MKTIKITKDKFVIVDDDDYERLSKHKWCVSGKYAGTWIKRNVLMHRFIMNCPKGFQVDHINHNTLDNRKENLRICTPMENSWNMKNVSGAGYIERTKKWVAAIGLFNKLKYIGSFDTEKEAHKAYLMMREKRNNHLLDNEGIVSPSH